MMIRRSAACACFRVSSNVFILSQTSFVESSLLIRYWFLSTTQKTNGRAVSGNLRRHRARRKQDSHRKKNQSNVDCFLWGALSTTSSCHRARQSISKPTRRSCSVCFAQSVRRDENCSRRNRGCLLWRGLKYLSQDGRMRSRIKD